MRPSLTAQLFLSFYGIQALQESYRLPAPRLEVEPSYPVPLGAALLLRCRGLYGPFSYRFCREALQEALSLEDSWWESATPHLRHPRVTAALAGRYRCHSGFPSSWSPLSLPRDVPVADLYEEPFLWATPGLSVPPGENVTFHCNSSKFVLYHSTPERRFQTLEPQSTNRNEAVVPLHNKTEEINGNYTCKGHVSSEPHRWSAASDNPMLSGRGLPPGCRKAVLLHVLLALVMLGA